MSYKDLEKKLQIAKEHKKFVEMYFDRSPEFCAIKLRDLDRYIGSIELEMKINL